MLNPEIPHTVKMSLDQTSVYKSIAELETDLSSYREAAKGSYMSDNATQNATSNDICQSVEVPLPIPHERAIQTFEKVQRTFERFYASSDPRMKGNAS